MKTPKHPKPQQRVYPEELKSPLLLSLPALELLSGTQYTVYVSDQENRAQRASKKGSDPLVWEGI